MNTIDWIKFEQSISRKDLKESYGFIEEKFTNFSNEKLYKEIKINTSVLNLLRQEQRSNVFRSTRINRKKSIGTSRF